MEAIQEVDMFCLLRSKHMSSSEEPKPSASCGHGAFEEYDTAVLEERK